MITIRTIPPDEWASFREIRLAALAEAPYAFSETLGEARRIPESKWRARLQSRSEGGNSTACVAYDENTPVGMAAAFLDSSRATIAYVVSVWVKPSHRGRGAARLLMESIAAWALSAGAQDLVLGVRKGNDRAAAFFLKQGFKPQAVDAYNSPATCQCEHVLKKSLVPHRAISA